jgi:hypothetical protein
MPSRAAINLERASQYILPHVVENDFPPQLLPFLTTFFHPFNQNALEATQNIFELAPRRDATKDSFSKLIDEPLSVFLPQIPEILSYITINRTVAETFFRETYLGIHLTQLAALLENNRELLEKENITTFRQILQLVYTYLTLHSGRVNILKVIDQAIEASAEPRED